MWPKPPWLPFTPDNYQFTIRQHCHPSYEFNQFGEISFLPYLSNHYINFISWSCSFGAPVIKHLRTTTLEVSSNDSVTISYNFEESETHARYELKNNEVLYASCQKESASLMKTKHKKSFALNILNHISMKCYSEQPGFNI